MVHDQQPEIPLLGRAEFLRLKGGDFVTAGVALGASSPRLIFRHVLPNSLAPVLVSATFGIAGAILLEAALSFLGFGVPPPTASWGSILYGARPYVSTHPWLPLYPGLAIFLTVTAYNLAGEALGGGACAASIARSAAGQRGSVAGSLCAPRTHATHHTTPAAPNT